MMNFQSHASTLPASLCARKIHNVTVELLHEFVQGTIIKLWPNQKCAEIQCCNLLRNNIRIGIILPYGCNGGQPDFIEINLF